MTKIHFPIFSTSSEKRDKTNPLKMIAYHENLINNKKIYHNSVKASDLNLKIKFDYYDIIDPQQGAIRTQYFRS